MGYDNVEYEMHDLNKIYCIEKKKKEQKQTKQNKWGE